MARQDDRVEIDGKQYHFTQLDPRRAAKVYMFLVGRIGSTMGKAIGALKGGKGLIDADVNMKDLGEAVQQIFQSLDDDKTIEHIDTLLSCVLSGSTRMSLDHLNFQGNMLHMTKVVKKSTEVNFSDFLGESSALGARVRGMFSMIQAKQMSTGSSGGQSSQESQPLKK